MKYGIRVFILGLVFIIAVAVHEWLKVEIHDWEMFALLAGLILGIMWLKESFKEKEQIWSRVLAVVGFILLLLPVLLFIGTIIFVAFFLNWR